MVEHYLSRPSNTVIAAVRNLEKPSSKSLANLPVGKESSLIIVKIDSTVESDARDAITRLKAEFGISKIDVVIANAGICKVYPTVAQAKVADMLEHFSVNAMGPLLLFQAVLPLMENAKIPKFVALSSGVASIADMGSTPVPHLAFGVSKAALNHIVRKISFEREKIIAFAIDPG